MVLASYRGRQVHLTRKILATDDHLAVGMTVDLVVLLSCVYSRNRF